MERFPPRRLVVGLPVLLLVLVSCGGKNDPPLPPPTSGGAPTELRDKPSPGDTTAATKKEITPPKKGVSGWTLDPAEMEPGDGKVAGRVGGQTFTLDSAKLSNRGVLLLRQGKGFSADREVGVVLLVKKGEVPANKTVEVSPKSTGELPPISLLWTVSGKFLTAIHSDKYAMKLQFGAEADGKLPGTIHLSLPDEGKSYVAGTFRAEIEPEYGKPPRPSEMPCVWGKISLAGRPMYDLAVGLVGLSAEGKSVINLSGTTITPKSETVIPNPPDETAGQVTTLVNETEDGCFYRHTRLPPGQYLIYARLGDRYLDWRWLEVKDKSQTPIDFAITADAAGALNVTVPTAVEKAKIALIPLDPEGKSPDLKEAYDFLAGVIGTEVAPKDGKILLDGLRPGRYRAVLGNRNAEVTIKAKETATLDLSK